MEAFLSNSDVIELTKWRRELHRYPELSGEEEATAARVIELLRTTGPDKLLTRLGGHGVAAVYEGFNDGPTVLFRCELDGLPITEVNPDLPHRSIIDGKAHLCGHDGHMAILAATARWLSRNPPDRGRIILLFQPAEEDGSGAAKVIADPHFDEIAPDYAFALHNFPGLPLGHAAISEGPINCASRGMKIVLEGRTSHASQPENGISPAPALASLIPGLTGLGHGNNTADPNFALVTVTHARMGAPAFGIAPGEAELWVTLRTQKDAGMRQLVDAAERLVVEAAANGNLEQRISFYDIFDHCENDPEATTILRSALEAQRIPIVETELPMRGSEDFGRFRSRSRSAMLLLGSGENSPSVHNPDFDFPDELIPIGAGIFVQAITSLCYTVHPAVSA